MNPAIGVYLGELNGKTANSTVKGLVAAKISMFLKALKPEAFTREIAELAKYRGKYRNVVIDALNSSFISCVTQSSELAASNDKARKYAEEFRVFEMATNPQVASLLSEGSLKCFYVHYTNVTQRAAVLHDYINASVENTQLRKNMSALIFPGFEFHSDYIVYISRDEAVTAQRTKNITGLLKECAKHGYVDGITKIWGYLKKGLLQVRLIWRSMIFAKLWLIKKCQKQIE